MVKIIIGLANFFLKISRLKYEDEKIMVVADFGTIGGTRTYFFNLVDFLIKYNKTFVCYIPKEQADKKVVRYLSDRSIPFYLKKGGFKVSLIDGHSRNAKIRNTLKLFKAASNIKSLIKKTATNKIIISTAYNDEYLYMFLLPVKKLTYINHTLAYYNINQLNKEILATCLSSGKQLVGVSNCSIKSMKNHYGILKKDLQHCKFLYNYSDFEIGIKKDFLNKTKLQISTIGHLENYKNPLMWIEIAKKVTLANPQYELKFCWAGEGSLLEKCKISAQDFTNIYFLGSIEKIYELLSETDIYIQPSEFESFGISLVDGMAMGIPVLAKNTTGLAEIIQDDNTGFLFDNEDEACDKLEYLIKNYGSLKEITETAKKEQLLKYSLAVWENEMKKLIEE